MNALQLFKSLSDESRLQIVSMLREKPHCVEDLAELLSLAESTVSAHLKKLQSVGLVYSIRQQYYSVFHIKNEILQATLQDLLPKVKQRSTDAQGIMRDKVIRAYFKDGKCVRMPVQNKKRWIVYQEIIRLIEPGREYHERELNELICTVYDDYCLIRRELVDEGVLRRTGGIYHLVDRYWENPGFYQKIWNMLEPESGTKSD